MYIGVILALRAVQLLIFRIWVSNACSWGVLDVFNVNKCDGHTKITRDQHLFWQDS